MFWKLFFWHFRAAQPVLIAFFDTLRRHSAFWEVFLGHFRAAQPVLGAAFGAL